jgi:hypothetical protein
MGEMAIIMNNGKLADKVAGITGGSAGRDSNWTIRRRYVTTDVFTDRMFGGTPLAVVADAEGLSTGPAPHREDPDFHAAH